MSHQEASTKPPSEKDLDLLERGQNEYISSVAEQQLKEARARARELRKRTTPLYHAYMDAKRDRNAATDDVMRIRLRIPTERLKVAKTRLERAERQLAKAEQNDVLYAIYEEQLESAKGEFEDIRREVLSADVDRIIAD